MNLVIKRREMENLQQHNRKNKRFLRHSMSRDRKILIVNFICSDAGYVYLHT